MAPSRVGAFGKIYFYQHMRLAKLLNKAYGDELCDLSVFSPNVRRLFDKGGILVDVLR
jgi:hypothetical protein